jgi:hypothetical protein
MITDSVMCAVLPFHLPLTSQLIEWMTFEWSQHVGIGKKNRFQAIVDVLIVHTLVVALKR